MRVRQCGAGRRRITCGPSTTGNTTSRGASASELTIVIPSDPPGLDPLVYSDAATDYLIITMIVETLYQYGPDRVIQPLLAVSPPTISTDGLTYTIPLQDAEPGKRMRTPTQFWTARTAVAFIKQKPDEVLLQVVLANGTKFPRHLVDGPHTTVGATQFGPVTTSAT